MKSYIDELNAFDSWSQYNQISATTAALWYTLMQINNKCGWKEWFNCPNVLIESRIGMNKMAIKRARDQLISMGLIEYKAGSNQWGASVYKLNSVSSMASHNVTPYDTPNQVPSHNVTPPVTPPVTLPRQRQDKEKDIYTAKNISTNVVCQYFQKYVRPLNSIIEAQSLITIANDYGDEVVKKAIDISVKKGKRNLNYIVAVANNMGAESIKQSRSSKADAIQIANDVIAYYEEEERKNGEVGYGQGDSDATTRF